MRTQLAFPVAAALALGLALWGCGEQDGHDDHDDHDPPKNDASSQGTEATPGHSHEKAEIHGGTVTMAEGYHFETVFHADSVQVYVYGPKQEPMDPRGSGGDVEIAFADGRDPIHATLAYVPPGGEKDMGLLMGPAGLAGTEGGKAKATIRLQGLPGEKKEATYVATVRLAPSSMYVCPMECVPPQKDPGKCSKCGMTLEEKPASPAVEDGGHDHGGHDHESIPRRGPADRPSTDPDLTSATPNA